MTYRVVIIEAETKMVRMYFDPSIVDALNHPAPGEPTSLAALTSVLASADERAIEAGGSLPSLLFLARSEAEQAVLTDELRGLETLNLNIPKES